MLGKQPAPDSVKPPLHADAEAHAPIPSDAERDRAIETRRLVYQYMPEIVPFIKELHGLGMLQGWRCVTFRLLANIEPVARTGSP